MDGKNHLTLLPMPDRDINHERILMALNALNDPFTEYEALHGIFSGLIDFYQTLDAPEAELIVYDLNKLLYYTENLYDDWLENE